MKKNIIKFSLILIVALTGLSYLILNYSYSEGNRVGKLVKLSEKGFFPKTWEGTLDLGSGDRLTWDFSVHDDAIAEKLLDQTGKMVNLEYRELLWRLFYNSNYDVTNWTLSEPGSDGSYLLCRLVDVIRKSNGLVETIRPLIEKYDPKLLSKVRECQK